MLNKKPIIRTHQLRSGCVIPVGWFFESILLILLVCAVRDLSSNVARIAEAMERLEKKEAVNQQGDKDIPSSFKPKSERSK